MIAAGLLFIGWRECRNVVLKGLGWSSSRGQGLAGEEGFRGHSTVLSSFGGVVGSGVVLRSVFLGRDGEAPHFSTKTPQAPLWPKGQGGLYPLGYRLMKKGV